jgi:hypothetical protein
MHGPVLTRLVSFEKRSYQGRDPVPAGVDLLLPTPANGILVNDILRRWAHG